MFLKVNNTVKYQTIYKAGYKCTTQNLQSMYKEKLK
jgi:hypothetical protein